jgi:hypothetical protein
MNHESAQPFTRSRHRYHQCDGGGDEDDHSDRVTAATSMTATGMMTTSPVTSRTTTTTETLNVKLEEQVQEDAHTLPSLYAAKRGK